MRTWNLQFAFLLALGFVVLAGAPASALRQVVERPVVPDSDGDEMIEKQVLPDFDGDEFLMIEKPVVPDADGYEFFTVERRVVPDFDEGWLRIGSERGEHVSTDPVHPCFFWLERKLSELGWLFPAWLLQQAR